MDIVFIDIIPIPICVLHIDSNILRHMEGVAKCKFWFEKVVIEVIVWNKRSDFGLKEMS